MMKSIHILRNFSLRIYLVTEENHSTEQCLTIMIEAWKKALDLKHSAGAILTDLSKAFDCLNHKLLIAKLNAYGLHKEALNFIYNYLEGRKQRTKVNN